MKKTVSIIVVLLLAIQLFVMPVGAEENAVVSVPQIRITTDAGNGTTLQKEDGYVPARILITDSDETVADQAINVKVRGNSTAYAGIKKKAYNFKFDNKKDLFGMGSGKKWCLLANTFDPTLLRNYTALEIARELGLEYTSNQKIVELWMDDSFRGCYLLTEPVQSGKDRVNIDIEGNDGMKDFLLELEAYRTEEGVSYITQQKMRFAVSEPEEPTAQQLEYINTVAADVLGTIKTGTKEEIEQKIDLSSFAKYYLLSEFVKPVDIWFSSVYFYYKDGRLYAGPAWDYDLSLGNTNPSLSDDYRLASEPDGLYVYNRIMFDTLCKYEWFNNAVKDVYRAHYGFFAGLYTDGGFLDTLRATYSDVIERNASQAGWKPGTAYINAQKYPLATYDENYNFLKNWCEQRNEYLTDYFGVLNSLTLVYSYNVYDEEAGAAAVKTVTKEISNPVGATIAQLAELNRPFVMSAYHNYGDCEYTENGDTINVTIPESEKKYTVSFDGVDREYGYLEQATLDADGERSFIIDGRVVYVGSSYSFYVCADTIVTTADPAEKAEYTFIDLNNVTITDNRVSLDMLATANVKCYRRMGVAFALSEKSADEITAAVRNVAAGSAASNRIYVYNSTVDTPNLSGQYQFRYAPYFAVDKAKRSNVYFYTFVEVDDEITVSDCARYDMSNLLA